MKKTLILIVGLLGFIGALEAAVPQGDCDGSGDVNLQDVICAVNIVLDGTSLGDGDCDASGNVNIQDVACTVDVVLNPTLSNSGQVPILLYHSWDSAGCTQETSDSLGLAADLEVLHQNGYTVVPAYWIAQWVVGDRDGSTLPEKTVGITFDDGENLDWVDSGSNPCSGQDKILSFKTVLENFKNAHPSIPDYSPHASSFVIASPVARSIIPGMKSDSWWNEAQNSSIMEIYNHSTDHDHDTIQGQFTDPALSSIPSLFPGGVKIASSGYFTNVWAGQASFLNVGNEVTAMAEVVAAADYISSKIGVYPDLFAYPYGGHTGDSAYLADDFFPNQQAVHGTYAAFTTVPECLSRSSDRYKLGRFVRRSHWTNSSQLMTILGC